MYYQKFEDEKILSKIVGFLLKTVTKMVTRCLRMMKVAIIALVD